MPPTASSKRTQSCEIALHIPSPDVYVHPPPPRSRLPGHDKTLAGLAQLMCPSERSIQAVRVTLQGLQTLAFPDPSALDGIRYEEKVVMNKTVEIADAHTPASAGSPTDAPSSSVPFPSKRPPTPVNDSVASPDTSSDAVEQSSAPRATEQDAPDASSSSARPGAPDLSRTGSINVKQEGLHLSAGIHGFEFAFIIPASSAAVERTRHARLRYVLTATAVGAGEGGQGDVSTWQDVFVIVQVQPDGGPTALDVQYHDVHEALGPVSVSLISASLTVGGAASVQVHHPDPPPGLSVHVIRVFLEQTIELYSSTRKAWLKLPPEKLRLWEKGCMPYKSRDPEDMTPNDTIWFAHTGPDGEPCQGSPGLGAGAGRPNMCPFGDALTGTFSHHTPAGPPQMPSAQSTGYCIKSIMRLPDHRPLRPSTVRGSKTDIRVTHEIGMEIFFSRTSIIDERRSSKSYGLPKVQVFTLRRAVAIPSCACTHDTIHLPPYSLESPIQSRPPTPHAWPIQATSPYRGSTIVPTATTPVRRRQNESDYVPFALTELTPTDGAHLSSRPPSPPVFSTQSRPGSNAPSRASSPQRDSRRRLRSGLSALTPGGRSRNSSMETVPHSGRGSTRGLHSLVTSNANHSQTRLVPASIASSAPVGMLGAPAALTPALSKSKSTQSLREARRAASGTGPASLRIDRASGNPPTSASSTPHKQRPNLLTRHSYHHGTRAVFGKLAAKSSTNLTATSDAAPYLAVCGVKANYSCEKQPPLPPRWSAEPPFYTGTTNTSRKWCNCGRNLAELADGEQRLLAGVPTAPGTWEDAAEGAVPPPRRITPTEDDNPVGLIINANPDAHRSTPKIEAIPV